MRTRMLLALIFLTAAIGPASAQQARRGDVRSETQNRLADEGNNDVIWNSIGLIGLLGLLGLRRQHSEDSYHPAALE
jgi:hypothetical protein